MKAFIAFVLILFLAIGALGGFWAWKKYTRVEEWGLALPLNSTLEENEKERMEERYNQILDRDDVLMNSIETHDLAKYYDVVSKEEALEKLKEDTFIRFHGNDTMHILFKGKRNTREERVTAISTLSQDFLKQVRSMSGQ